MRLQLAGHLALLRRLIALHGGDATVITVITQGRA